MATTFQVKRSSVAGKVPNTSTLSIGELGLNLTDQILYSSNGTGVFELGANVTNQTVKTSLLIGNSSVNTTINSTSISVSKVVANGAFGTDGQILVSNGTSMYWDNPAGGTQLIKQQYTANGTHSEFTVTGGYTSNNLQVYLNGVLLRNGVEANVQSGSTFTITPTPSNGSLIDVYGISTLYANGVSTVVSQQFTANGTANSFTITNGYIPNQIQVYLNGVKQVPSVDIDVSSGSTVNFIDTPANGYIVDVYGYQTSVSYYSNNLIVGNVSIGTDTISVGNSSVNTQIVAGNVYLNGSTLVVGNTSTNVTINSTSISIGANNLTVGTSLYAVSNGNVGIGTSSPSRLLTLGGSGDQYINRSVDNGSIILTGGVGITSGQLSGGFVARGGSSSYNQGGVEIYTNGGERLRITSAGNVGIGISSPSGLLDVASSSSTRVGYFKSTNTDYVLPITIWNSSVTQANGGEWGFGINGSVPSTFSSMPSGSFWIHRDGAGAMMTITPTGNVGIGTASPDTILDARKTNASYWGQTTTNTWGGTLTPPQALAITNSQPNGYDPVLLFRQATSTGTIKTSGAIGLVGGSNWIDGNDATQYSNMYFAIRNTTGGLQEIMRFTVDGRVGVGRSSPSYTLDVNGSSRTDYILFGSNTTAPTADAAIYRPADGTLGLVTNSTERMRITSAGNVGIGTTTPGTIMDIIGPSGAARGMLLRIASDNGAYLQLVKPGFHEWYVGTPTDTNALVFGNGRNIVADGTERMRITSAGNIYLGTTTGLGTTTRLSISYTGAGSMYGIEMKPTSSGSTYALYLRNSAGSFVGGINPTDSATNYLSASDYRLKENIVLLDDPIERLKQLLPRRFNFKNTPNNTVDGFIAHEVSSIVPEAVIGEKDQIDKNGKPVYQAMDNSKLVPLLTASIQKAIEKIEMLESRIQQLETN